MKLVFMDIDGVILKLPYQEKMQGFSMAEELEARLKVNSDSLEHLRRIVQETSAEIVISSAWRHYLSLSQFQHVFQGIGPVIGMTPDGGRSREAQIRRFIEGTACVTQFVILDDEDFDMGDLLPHVVRTDARDGLTAHDADTAIKILSESA